jgi:type II secretory pathway component PulF
LSKLAPLRILAFSHWLPYSQVMTRADVLREMATFLEAGVPLAQGLLQLAPSLPQPWKARAHAWSDHLSRGERLSSALASVPPGLSLGDFALIDAAESCGRLGPTLHELANAAEASQRRRSRLSTALIYPLLLFHGAAVIPAFLTFVQSGPVRGLGQILLILIPAYLVCGLLVWALRSKQNQTGPAWIDLVLDRIPLLGRGLRLAATARFCAILAGLLESGVRVETALQSAGQASGDRALRDHLLTAGTRVEAGTNITEILESSGRLDETTLSMVRGGELAGTLPNSLRRASDRCEFGAQQQLDRLALLAPMACYFFAVLIALAQILRILAPLFATYRQVLE